jgi:hypothetical protein
MTQTPYDPDTMRARFHELGRRAAQIRATSPRIERDARAAELTTSQFLEFRAKILAHEEDLYAIDTERATLARALGGKTGEA